VLIIAVGLREVPHRSLWLVVASAAQKSRRASARPRIHRSTARFSQQVHNIVWARSLRMGSAIVGTSQRAASVGNGNDICAPFATPGIPTMPDGAARAGLVGAIATEC